MNINTYWQPSPSKSTARKLLVLWPFWLVLLWLLMIVYLPGYVEWLYTVLDRVPSRFPHPWDVVEMTLEYILTRVLP